MKIPAAMDQLLLKDGRGPEFATHDVENEEEETNASQNLSLFMFVSLFARLLHMDSSLTMVQLHAGWYTPKLVF